MACLRCFCVLDACVLALFVSLRCWRASNALLVVCLLLARSQCCLRACLLASTEAACGLLAFCGQVSCVLRCFVCSNADDALAE